MIARRQWLVALALWLTAANAVSLSRVQFYHPDQVGGYRDVVQYARMSREEPTTGQRRYRIVTPTLAGLVPEAPLRALSSHPDRPPHWVDAVRFALVNAAFLVLTAAVLLQLMVGLGLSYTEGLGGTLLFFTAQPVIQGGGLPMVDPSAWFFLALALLGVLQRRALVVFGAVAVGMFAKETTALIVPLILATPMPRRARWQLLAATLPGIAAYLALRFALAPDPAETLSNVAVLRDRPTLPLRWLWSILTHPNMLVDLVSSFGLLWLPAYVAWRDRATPPLLRRWAVLVPILLVLIVLLFGNLGRVLFLAFPVVIPLAAFGLRRWWARTGATRAPFVPPRTPVGRPTGSPVPR